MTGYDLGQVFSSTANWVWAAPLSQIYPLLARLSDEGLLEGSTGFSGKRAHTTYSITELGRTELRRWVAEWHDPQPTRDPLLLQSLFFDLIEPDAAAKLLDRLIDEEERRIRQWERHRDLLSRGVTPLLSHRLESRPAADHERIKRVKAATFSGLIGQAQARIDWAIAMKQAVRPDRTREQKTKTNG